jgi:hypothetical protein
MLPFRLAGYVTGHGANSVGWVQAMTPVERHAELTYAESLFEKVRGSFEFDALLCAARPSVDAWEVHHEGAGGYVLRVDVYCCMW